MRDAWRHQPPNTGASTADFGPDDASGKHICGIENEHHSMGTVVIKRLGEIVSLGPGPGAGLRMGFDMDTSSVLVRQAAKGRKQGEHEAVAKKEDSSVSTGLGFGSGSHERNPVWYTKSCVDPETLI